MEPITGFNEHGHAGDDKSCNKKSKKERTMSTKELQNRLGDTSSSESSESESRASHDKKKKRSSQRSVKVGQGVPVWKSPL